jgi:arabinan endo-1,5-alpha-L-arabinosidase
MVRATSIFGVACVVLGVVLSCVPTYGKEVFARDVHDPCIAREGGTYYVFSTGNGIPIRQSNDLVHWHVIGQVFDSLPSWVKREIPANYAQEDKPHVWAPDISFFNGEYHLYYAVSTWGSNRSCIGLATNKTLDPQSPDYKWRDHGKVIETREGADWNAIDPNIVLDGQVPWLCCGSFWSGIKMCQIDLRTGKPVNNRLASLAARPEAQAIEAPFIVHHGHFYYLFVSFDHCCKGVDSDYKIMVGRSDCVFGPYFDQKNRPMLKGGGTLVLKGQGRIRGPGGQSVLAETGKWWLVYHFYDAESNGVPCLQIRPLNWENGWPIAGGPLPGVTEPDGGKPPIEPTPALSREQIVGKWRHFVGDDPREISFFLSGKINDESSRATWMLKGRALTLTWPTDDAPGGAWIDRCRVSADGKSYRGKNQQGVSIHGTKLQQ